MAPDGTDRDRLSSARMLPYNFMAFSNWNSMEPIGSSVTVGRDPS
jgi:hypothetical protein